MKITSLKKNHNFNIIKVTKNYIIKKNEHFNIIKITALKKIKILTSKKSLKINSSKNKNQKFNIIKITSLKKIKNLTS